VKVRTVMTKDVVACQPHSNLAEVATQMWHRDCGALPVVDALGHVAGMVTDRDICIAVAMKGRPADRISVQEVSTGQLFAVAPDDDLQTALNLMTTHQVRRLPVIDAHGALVGIVSMNDIVLRANEGADLPPAAIVDAMKGICAHRHP